MKNTIKEIEKKCIKCPRGNGFVTRLESFRTYDGSIIDMTFCSNPHCEFNEKKIIPLAFIKVPTKLRGKMK